MTLEEIQALADKTQTHIDKAIAGMTKLQKIACNAAAENPDVSDTVGQTQRSLGHLWIAHGCASDAATAMPDITPKFGDK